MPLEKSRQQSRFEDKARHLARSFPHGLASSPICLTSRCNFDKTPEAYATQKPKKTWNTESHAFIYVSCMHIYTPLINIVLFIFLSFFFFFFWFVLFFNILCHKFKYNTLMFYSFWFLSKIIFFIMLLILRWFQYINVLKSDSFC